MMSTFPAGLMEENVTILSALTLRRVMLEEDGKYSGTNMDGGEEDNLKLDMERSTTEIGKQELMSLNLMLNRTKTSGWFFSLTEI